MDGPAASPAPTTPLSASGPGIAQQMQANDAETQKILSAESAQMKPAVDKASSLLSADAPKAPQLQAAPESPKLKEEQAHNAQEFLASAILIGGIAGALSRSHVTTALNAFGATIKGYREGQIQAGQEAFEEFKSASEAVKANNAAMQTEYQNALADRKMGIDQQMAQVQLIATQYHDQLMAQAAGSKNYLLVAQLMERQAEATEKFNIAYDKLDQQHSEFDQKIKTQMAQQGLEMDEQGNIKPQTVDPSTFGQVATGEPLNQIIPGYGPAAARKREQARAGAIQTIMNETSGMSPEQAGVELANRAITYTAGKSSEQQLTKMAGATKQAVDQLDWNVDQTTKEMAKLKSSDISPVVNAIARGAEKWTGDPAYAGLFFYISAAATEAARIRSGGQASAAQLHQGAADEAQKWANINMTPASWQEVAGEMKAEGRQKLKTFQDAIVYQRQQGGRGGGNAGGGADEMHYDAQGNLVK